MTPKDKTESFLELIERHNQLQRERKKVLKELVALQSEFAGGDKAFEAVIMLDDGAEINVKIVNPEMQMMSCDDLCTDGEVDLPTLEEEDGGELGLVAQPRINPDTFRGEISSFEDLFAGIFKTSQIKVLRQIETN